MIRRKLLILFLAIPAAALQAAGSPEDATAKLKSAVDEVLVVADRASSSQAFTQSVSPILQKHINFTVMTKRAIGPGWKSFSADQQQKAVKLFTTLVIRTYTAKFTPGQRPSIEYQKAVSPAAGRVDVPTKMQYQGSRYSVNYRMEAESGWTITDVTIEGVSLVANYRSQLDAQFKKGGAESVITSLSQSISRPS